MRIAFDATVLHGRKSGVGYYCEELLKCLLANDHESDYFIFSHKPLSLEALGGNGNLLRFPDRHFPIRAVYLHALLPGVLDQVRPDLCHYTNFLAPISDDNPYVVTVHDMGLEVLSRCHPLAKRLYTKRLIPRVARNARLVLTNSNYSKWQIVRYLGIPEDRIRITPLAASPDFRPVTTNKPSTPYFLYVGNLEPRKNLERLLEAFAQLKHLDHELWIAGNTWYRGSAIQKKAASLGLEGRVRFLGYVPRQDLPGLYSNATAFVYPSLLEGFGMPVVEAMACGTPTITSNNSALKEVAGDAALLIDPVDPRSIAEAMGRFALEERDREAFRQRGLARAAEFSWEKTAELTLDAYREASARTGKGNWVTHGGIRGRTPNSCTSEFGVRPRIPPCVTQFPECVADAIDKTVSYARVFDYPLKPAELHERMFDVAVDPVTFSSVLSHLNLKRHGEFIAENRDQVAGRIFREAISDRAIEQMWPRLQGLASFPFVRMVAFSGSTAHRNMASEEDLDLFVIVESGKLWATFLAAIIWARWHGVRHRLCMNYLITDSVLPLFEDDAFTAQQMASLKPFYGKSLYDRFMAMNPFVRRHFPNFDARRHREVYPEVETSAGKGALESVLRLGPVQALELLSRGLLGWYLRRKAQRASAAGECDVLLEPQRLKLHMHSHKRAVVSRLDAAPSALTPAAD